MKAAQTETVTLVTESPSKQLLERTCCAPKTVPTVPPGGASTLQHVKDAAQNEKAI